MNITNKEHEVLSVLWSKNRALSAKEIIELLPAHTWKDSMIHSLLNSLLKKELIQVDGVFRSGRTYGRYFSPVISMEEYHAQQIRENQTYIDNKKTKLPGIIAALIDDDIDAETLKALEEMIDAKKRELEK